MRSREAILKNTVTGAFVFLIALCLLFMVKAWMGGHFESMDALREYISSYGSWGPAVLILIQALQVVLPVLPGPAFPAN